MKSKGITVVTIVLSIILFCSSGCNSSPNIKNNSSKTEREKSIITVCIEEKMQGAAELLRQNMIRQEEDFDVVFDLIPDEENERKVKLEEMRTELMAGKGPDVFLLPSIDTESEYAWGMEGTLFPYMESAIRNGYFLPLDDLLKMSGNIELGKMNPAVLTSGKYDDTQYVLPVLYTFFFAAADRSKVSLDFPEYPGWDDIVSSGDAELFGAFDAVLVYGFSNLFPALADFQTDKLLVTESDIAQRLKDVAMLHEKGNRQNSVPANGDITALFSTRCRLDSFTLENLGKSNGNERMIYPLMNMDGKVTATPTMFAAINANAQNPQGAFAFLEPLFSYGQAGSVYEEICLKYEGVPIIDDAFEDYVSSLGNGTLSEKYISRLKEISQDIGSCHFWSPLDTECTKAVIQIYNDSTEENISSVAKETYKILTMCIAES